jgi:hypothetical protein
MTTKRTEGGMTKIDMLMTYIKLYRAGKISRKFFIELWGRAYEHTGG